MINLKFFESITNDQINRFQSYAEDHQIFDLFQDIVRQLAIHQPKDPILWIANHLEKKQVPNIVVIAPPASNESKLCEELAKTLGAEHISTSQLLQAAIEKKSNLGQQALPFFTKGQLVPDRVVFELIALRLGQAETQKSGYVLEGFPKTRSQLQMMQKRGMLPTHWLCLDIPAAEILDRVSHIYVDPVTNQSYHLDTVSLPSEIQARLIQKYGYTVDDVQARIQAHVFHIKQMHESCPSLVSVPFSLNDEFQAQFKAVARAIHIRPPFSGPIIHRLFICNGTKQQRHAICSMLESHYKLVYLCRQRLYLDDPQIDPYTQTYEQLLLKLKKRLEQSRSRTLGFVVNLEWDIDLFQMASTMDLPKPNRVLYLQDGNNEFKRFLEAHFGRMEHPFFHSQPKQGKLQELKIEKNVENMVENVRTLLLRPIPYWSTFCEDS